MPDAKWTPGPWKHGRLDMTTIVEIEGKFIYGQGNSPVPVAVAHADKEGWQANARLIAEAPTMAATLRKLIEWADRQEIASHDRDLWHGAAAVLAKAEGGSDDQ